MLYLFFIKPLYLLGWLFYLVNVFLFFIFSGKTKRGELSIFPRSFIVLSHCLHMMPRQKAAPGSENANVKVRRRDLELSKIGIMSCCN